MAITLTTLLSATFSGSAAQTATSASFTPGANRKLYVAVVTIADGASTGHYDTAHVSNTGGLTFARVALSTDDPGTAFDPGIALFEAEVGGSPSAMTVTFDVDDGGTRTAYTNITAFDAVGSVGDVQIKSGQIVARAEADGGGNTETHASGTLSAAVTSGNTAVLLLGRNNDANGAATTPTGWTALYNPVQQFVSTCCWYHTAFTGTSETVTDCGQSITSTASVLLELEEASGAVDITPVDSAHGHTSESPALTQVHSLPPVDSAHAHAAEAPTLTQAHELAPVDSAHGHASESPGLTVTHVLAPADSAHEHAVEQPTVTQVHAIAPLDSTHAHATDAASLTQVHNLAPVDSAHAHTSTSPNVEAGGSLAPQDSIHGHATESPTLTQAHVLAAADSLHQHATDAPTLTQTHALAPDDTSHTHTSTSPSLGAVPEITPADSSHGHTTEAPTLAQVHYLTPASSNHAHTADQPTLAQVIYLNPNTSLHAHTAETTFVVDATLRPPTERTLNVPAENRTQTVPREARTTTIPAEAKTLTA